MKVTVLAPLQVANGGTVWRPGDVAEVPDEVGRETVASGWVTEVEPIEPNSPARLAKRPRTGFAGSPSDQSGTDAVLP
jgi:hypothetical protein